jgi:hypothetical protein
MYTPYNIINYIRVKYPFQKDPEFGWVGNLSPHDDDDMPLHDFLRAFHQQRTKRYGTIAISLSFYLIVF